MSNQENLSIELVSAREAIQRGDVSGARRQLLQILQHDRENCRAWLWLSGITSQADASLEYALRAQSIAPEDQMVIDAVKWAKGRKKQKNLVEFQDGSEGASQQQLRRPARPDIGLPVRDRPHVVQPISHADDNNMLRDNASDGLWRWLGLALLLLAVLALLIYIISIGGTLFGTSNTYSAVMASSHLVEPDFAEASALRQTGGVNMARAAPDAWALAEAKPTLPPIVVIWREALEEVDPVDESVGLDSAEIISQLPELTPKAPLELDAPLPGWTPTPAPTPQPPLTPQPTATPLPTLASSSSVQFNEWRWVDVNLTTQFLIAYENGEEVFSTHVSTGLPATPTVVGQFRIYQRYETQNMTGYHLGYDYNLPNVPNVQYFHGNYGLHGAYWHENFGNPMSHGCVNLDESDAAWLYNFTEIGTLVNVHY